MSRNLLSFEIWHIAQVQKKKKKKYNVGILTRKMHKLGQVWSTGIKRGIVDVAPGPHLWLSNCEMIWQVQLIVTCMALCRFLFYNSLLLSVTFLISNRFKCVISQIIKENEFMIKFLIYYLWLALYPWGLRSNYFAGKLLFWTIWLQRALNFNDFEQHTLRVWSIWHDTKVASISAYIFFVDA